MVIFSTLVGILAAVMSYPIFSLTLAILALYRGKYPLITIQFTSKTCCLVFPDPKIGGGVPSPVPKCTGWPRVGGGGKMRIRLIYIYIEIRNKQVTPAKDHLGYLKGPPVKWKPLTSPNIRGKFGQKLRNMETSSHFQINIESPRYMGFRTAKS